MAILLMISSSIVSGEEEPNNSITLAERIGEGAYNGEVGGSDDDFFEVELPSRSKLTLSLGKPSGDRGSVHLSTFDENGVELWLTGVSMTVSEYSEMDTDDLLNAGTSPVSYFFKISGSGNYSLKVEIDPLPQIEDEHSSKETALQITDGIYYDDVTTDYTLGSDVDYFMVKVPDDHRLEVTLTMISGDDDSWLSSISMDGDFQGSGLLDLFFGSVYEPGETDSCSWVNNEGKTVEYYLIIEGNGEYSIEVNVEDISDQGIDVGSSLTRGVLIVCGGGIFTMIVILVTVIVVIMIMRRKDGGSRKN